MAEPARRSLLDILHEQMKFMERNVYLHRVIYCGEFNQNNEGTTRDIIESKFQDSIKIVNDHHHDEKITGLLLLYEEYFIHLIEGSEECLAKHLQVLMTDAALWGRTKLLVTYHHINQRFFDGWFYECAIPPTSLDKREPSMDIKENYDIALQVVTKVYNLAQSLCGARKRNTDPETSFSNEQIHSATIYDRKVIINNSTENLPSVTLLEFILSSSLIENLNTYVKKFGTPFELEKIYRVTWPLSLDFVPFNVFEIDEDPVQDLPHKSDIPKRTASQRVALVSSQTMITPPPPPDI